jgi:hypothetical protein
MGLLRQYVSRGEESEEKGDWKEPRGLMYPVLDQGGLLGHFLGYRCRGGEGGKGE